MSEPRAATLRFLGALGCMLVYPYALGEFARAGLAVGAIYLLIVGLGILDPDIGAA